MYNVQIIKVVKNLLTTQPGREGLPKDFSRKLS
uniref:Uncharacterized protein n=1 Tax=Anguilla anguilla TaxID=7936 RepID=A0A0E9PL75_ANGAN